MDIVKNIHPLKKKHICRGGRRTEDVNQWQIKLRRYGDGCDISKLLRVEVSFWK